MAFQGFGEIAERLRRCTVQVISSAGSQGSGIVVGADGVIATNAHVARGGELLVRLWDGSTVGATLERRSRSRDLALLRATRGRGSSAPPRWAREPGATAILADSDRVRPGELAIAAGNPLGFIGAISTGVVLGVGRFPGLGPAQWIHSDVRLAPGNSGGPLANARGEVIGINTMIAGGLGLATPGNAVARMLRGDGDRAPLGIVVREAAIRGGRSERLGLQILEIIKGGAAEYASLEPGDTLVGIEGAPFNSLDDLERATEGEGERIVRLQFLRNDPNRTRTVAVRLGSRRDGRAGGSPAAAWTAA
jgi:serine protease Do